MSTLSPIPHRHAENAEADPELQAYRRCQTKFQTLRPVLNKYTEQKMEISQRWNFQLLCIQYVFKCEAQEEDSFFDYVLSPEGEVVEDEAFAVFDAIYTALEARE